MRKLSCKTVTVTVFYYNRVIKLFLALNIRKSLNFLFDTMDKPGPGPNQSVYKKGGYDPEESRSRRHEVTVELRKSKKEDELMKRRNIGQELQSDTDSKTKTPQMMEYENNNDDEEMKDVEKNNMQIMLYSNNNNEAKPKANDKDNGSGDDIDVVMNTVQEIMLAVGGSIDEEYQFLGIQSARKLLSHLRHPPIDMLIHYGLLPYCVEFLKRHHNPKLQLEAAWTLTNVASGTSEQTMAVVNAGAVPHLVALLRSKSKDVVEQAIWALSNISGDGPECRDLVHCFNIIDYILPLLNVPDPITFGRNLTWLIAVLCRGPMEPPSFSQVARLLPHLVHQLNNTPDIQVLSNTVWAFTYMTDRNYHQIRVVLQSGAVPRIIGFLDHANIAVLMPALRCIANIITKSDELTDLMISLGVLPYLAKLLQHEKLVVIKLTSWIVSNMSYNQNHIQAMLEAHVYTQLGKIMSQGDFRIQREVVWCITNTIASATPLQNITMVDDCGVLKPFVEMLGSQDTRTLLIVLTGIGSLFNLAVKLGATPSFCLKFEELGGLDRVEKLQMHYHMDVYEMAFEIIDTYYPEVEDSGGNHRAPKQRSPRRGAGDGASQEELEAALTGPGSAGPGLSADGQSFELSGPPMPEGGFHF